MRVTVHGVDRSTEFQPAELEAISIQLMADKGEPGSGTSPLPDPTATQEPYAGYQFRLDVGGTDIIDGFVGSLQRDRNEVAGDTRLMNTYTVIDENGLLNGHRAIKWKRPAETDVERITAFVDDFLGYLSLDTTWLLATHAKSLTAKTYTSESLVSELQTDCGDPTGKTMFLERGRFHWHLPTEGIISDIAIVLAEDADFVDSFTNMSQNPPTRSKDPIDLATDVVAMNDKGVTASATDATAISRHDSDGARHEVLVSGASMTAAQLQTLANQTLSDRKAERITYEGEIGPMTAEQVERIPVGCLINVTDKVWGLTSSTQRIASETIRYIHPDMFMVAVLCAYPVRIRSKAPITTPPPGMGLDGGILPPFEPEYPSGECATSGYDYTAPGTRTALGLVPYFTGGGGYEGISTDFMQYGNTFDNTTTEVPTPGLHGRWGDGGIALCTFPSGGVDYTSGGIPIWVRITVIGPGTLTAETAHHIGGLNPPCSADATAATANVVASGTSSLIDTDTQPLGTTLTVTVPDDGYCAHFIDISADSGAWGFVSATWSTAPLNAPSPGQPVNDACYLGDGVTTAVATQYPYLPDSLGLLVNGLDWLSEITETDPTTGSGTSSYAPPLGSTVCPRYRSA